MRHEDGTIGYMTESGLPSSMAEGHDIRRSIPTKERLGFRGKIVVVSNRLPINLTTEDDGNGGKKLTKKQTYGGLVTAMSPIVQAAGSDAMLWIGWPGPTGKAEKEGLEEVLRSEADGEIPMKEVILTDRQVQRYYNEFSNQILWWVNHGGTLLQHADFKTARQKHSYTVYRSVNKQFAQTIYDTTSQEDFIWVQDYHLMLAGEELRKMNQEMDSGKKKNQKIGYYLHTPFAPAEDYRAFKENMGKNHQTGKYVATELLEGLLAYDMVGFQTEKDRNNFLACLRDNATELPPMTFEQGPKNEVFVQFQGRRILLKNYVISIDAQEFSSRAQAPEVRTAAEEFYAACKGMSEQSELDPVFQYLDSDTQKIGQIGRLEPTKGFPHALRMYSRMLQADPTLLGQVQYLLIAPFESRKGLSPYDHLNLRLHQLVDAMNNRYEKMYKEQYPDGKGWKPVVFSTKGLTGPYLLAFYRYILDLLFVSPLADGSNLVAAEGPAAGVKKVAVSQHAGLTHNLQAFGEFGMIFDPYNLQMGAQVMERAVKMPDEEAMDVMQAILQDIYDHTIFDFAEDYLTDGAGLYQQAA